MTVVSASRAPSLASVTETCTFAFVSASKIVNLMKIFVSKFVDVEALLARQVRMGGAGAGWMVFR